jgi:hypothetical protein
MGLLDNQNQQAYYSGNNFGGYQFVSLTDIINQFMFVYVGEDKIIPKARRVDVAFHAQRALAELSFDTFKSCKAMEITVPSTLQMILPQDYVNYTKISWVDSSGIKHLLYPISKTSNPSSKPLQDSYGDFIFSIESVGDLISGSTIVILDAEYQNIQPGMAVTGVGVPTNALVSSVSTTLGITTIVMSITIPFATPQTVNTVQLTFTNANGSSIQQLGDTDTWANYKSSTPSENQDDYIDGTYWPMNGSRSGLDPQHAQANGSFYIDDILGKIHFSSNISGRTVILDYISDSLGTTDEMKVHKFAEEAMYRWIAHAIIAGRINIPEYQVQRFKKEKFAAVRTAKLRLSNIKLEEITQILRGKSKQIKH